MDRQEMNRLGRTIRDLMGKGDYEEVVSLAEKTHVTRHASGLLVLDVVEAYEKLGDKERAKDTLLAFYDSRGISGKNMMQKLINLCTETGDINNAVGLCMQFENQWPDSRVSYLMRYQIVAAAEGGTLDEQIRYLEQYKEAEFDERWAYELARLYERNNQPEECAALCHEIICFFGQGPYVEKAARLKSKVAGITKEERGIIESASARRRRSRLSSPAQTSSAAGDAALAGQESGPAAGPSAGSDQDAYGSYASGRDAGTGSSLSASSESGQASSDRASASQTSGTFNLRDVYGPGSKIESSGFRTRDKEAGNLHTDDFHQNRQFDDTYVDHSLDYNSGQVSRFELNTAKAAQDKIRQTREAAERIRKKRQREKELREQMEQQKLAKARQAVKSVTGDSSEGPGTVVRPDEGQKAASQKAPVQKAPAQGVTVQKTPAQSTSAQKASAQKAPVQSAASQKAPVPKAPVSGAPAPQTPVSKTSDVRTSDITISDLRLSDSRNPAQSVSAPAGRRTGNLAGTASDRYAGVEKQTSDLTMTDMDFTDYGELKPTKPSKSKAFSRAISKMAREVARNFEQETEEIPEGTEVEFVTVGTGSADYLNDIENRMVAVLEHLSDEEIEALSTAELKALYELEVMKEVRGEVLDLLDHMQEKEFQLSEAEVERFVGSHPYEEAQKKLDEDSARQAKEASLKAKAEEEKQKAELEKRKKELAAKRFLAYSEPGKVLPPELGGPAAADQTEPAVKAEPAVKTEPADTVKAEPEPDAVVDPADTVKADQEPNAAADSQEPANDQPDSEDQTDRTADITPDDKDDIKTDTDIKAGADTKANADTKADVDTKDAGNAAGADEPDGHTGDSSDNNPADADSADETAGTGEEDVVWPEPEPVKETIFDQIEVQDAPQSFEIFSQCCTDWAELKGYTIDRPAYMTIAVIAEEMETKGVALSAKNAKVLINGAIRRASKKGLFSFLSSGSGDGKPKKLKDKHFYWKPEEEDFVED